MSIRAKKGEILGFIAQFAEARELFLRGMCYWFAVILQNRFLGAIYYLPIANHFVTRIGGRYYDASGDVTGSMGEHPVYWHDYKNTDLGHAKQIICDCILKLEDT